MIDAIEHPKVTAALAHAEASIRLYERVKSGERKASVARDMGITRQRAQQIMTEMTKIYG